MNRVAVHMGFGFYYLTMGYVILYARLHGATSSTSEILGWLLSVGLLQYAWDRDAEGS
jgi:hypothetical protein